MPGFSKKLKINSLTSSRFGKYLLYAAGEIILVVVGILIALTINNRNEENKQTETLNGILKNVMYDLEQDRTRINLAIQYYESRKEFTDKILNDQFTENDYRTCLFCPSVLVFQVPVTISDKGYTQLKYFYETTDQIDSLVTDINVFYNNTLPNLEIIKTEVKNNTLENLRHWRDNYDWFPKIISRQGDARFIEYTMNDPDFKNRIAYFNVISGQNYLGVLKSYQTKSRTLLKQIKHRFDDSKSN